MEQHNEVLIRTWPIPGRLTWSRSPVCADLAPRKRRSRFSPESCARAVRPFGCAGLAPVYLPVSLPCMCRSRPRAFAGRGSVSLLCTRRSRSRVCAGTVSLPSYVRVQLQRLRGSRLGCVRASLPCLRWPRPSVNAGLAPGFAPARTLTICAGFAPLYAPVSFPCTSVGVPVNSGTYLKMWYVFWSIWGTYFDYF